MRFISARHLTLLFLGRNKVTVANPGFTQSLPLVQTGTIPQPSNSRSGMTQQATGPVTAYPRGLTSSSLPVAQNLVAQSLQVMTLQTHQPLSSTHHHVQPLQQSNAVHASYYNQSAQSDIGQIPQISSSQINNQGCPVGMLVVSANNPIQMATQPGLGSNLYTHPVDATGVNQQNICVPQVQQPNNHAQRQVSSGSHPPQQVQHSPYILTQVPVCQMNQPVGNFLSQQQQQQQSATPLIPHPHAYHHLHAHSGTLYVPTGPTADTFTPSLMPSAQVTAFRK